MRVLPDPDATSALTVERFTVVAFQDAKGRLGEIIAIGEIQRRAQNPDPPRPTGSANPGGAEVIGT